MVLPFTKQLHRKDGQSVSVYHGGGTAGLYRLTCANGTSNTKLALEPRELLAIGEQICAVAAEAIAAEPKLETANLSSVVPVPVEVPSKGVALAKSIARALSEFAALSDMTLSDIDRQLARGPQTAEGRAPTREEHFLALCPEDAVKEVLEGKMSLAEAIDLHAEEQTEDEEEVDLSDEDAEALVEGAPAPDASSN